MQTQSIKEFREQLHKAITLVAPSGNQYVVKRLTAMDYIKAGLSDIPNDFFKFVFALQTGKHANFTKEDEQKNYALFEKYLSVTLEQGIVSPPITLRYDKEKEDTHLLWAELPPKDQDYIVGVISGRIEPDEKRENKPDDKVNETAKETEVGADTPKT